MKLKREAFIYVFIVVLIIGMVVTVYAYYEKEGVFLENADRGSSMNMENMKLMHESMIHNDKTMTKMHEMHENCHKMHEIMIGVDDN